MNFLTTKDTVPILTRRDYSSTGEITDHYVYTYNYYTQIKNELDELFRHPIGNNIRCDRIKRVIFSGPATIILWKDGTKTVVKCQEGEEDDREKAIALCMVKKVLGNKGNYYNHIRKALEMGECDD